MAKGTRTVLPLPDGIAEHSGLARLEHAVPLGGGYHNLLLRLDDVDGFVSAYVDAGGPGEPEVLDEGVRIFVLANVLYALSRDTAGNRDWIEFLLGWLRELP